MHAYGGKPDVRHAFDKMQRQLKCCGTKRYDDWFDVRTWLLIYWQTNYWTSFNFIATILVRKYNEAYATAQSFELEAMRL